MKHQNLKGSVVIVTGASSGIGYAAALELARRGAQVVAAARNEAALRRLQREAEALGGQVRAVPTDVSVREQVEALVEEAVRQEGQVDGLVANAGQYFRSRIAEADVALFEQSFAVNFYGVLYAVKAALPHMTERDRGRIVIVNSLDAKKGIVGDGPYVAAKSALAGLADVLRQELQAGNVRVTSIYPGRVDTPMVEGLRTPWISPKIPPEAVVRAILKALKSGMPEIVVPGVYAPLGALNSTLPRLMDWIYRRFKVEGIQEKQG